MDDERIRGRILALIGIITVEQDEHRAWAISYLHSGNATEMVRHEALANSCRERVDQLQTVLRGN